MKMIELSELKPTESAVPQSCWAIGVEFPHVITKHNQMRNSDELTFFKSLGEAFIARRKMSAFYQKAWKAYVEFDNHRNSLGVSSY